MIHATACVDAGAEIGEGTRIWHFSHVMGGARIGRACTLGQNVFVGDAAVPEELNKGVGLFDLLILRTVNIPPDTVGALGIVVKFCGGYVLEHWIIY